MTGSYHYQKIARSRIATFDIYSIGLSKHHISAMLEFDVTESRQKLRDLRKKGTYISFNAWLIKVIGAVLQKHPEAASYLYNKKRLIIFDDINVSVLIEKKISDTKVPIPVVIEKVNEKSVLEIAGEIEQAKSQELQADDIVLKSNQPVTKGYTIIYRDLSEGYSGNYF